MNEAELQHVAPGGLEHGRRPSWRLSWPGLKVRAERCPSCQHKRFSPYLTEQGNRADAGGLIFGRCSRVNSCGYHLKPWEVLEGFSGPVTPYQPVQRVERRQVKYISAEFRRKHDRPNVLTRYVEHTFGPGSAAEVARRFDVGTLERYGREHVVFWQADQFGNIHTGKAIPYEIRGGQLKRLRGSGGGAYWMHKALDTVPLDLEWTSQFFGLKQLDTLEAAPVAVVESEKTAILCALAFPNFAWVATGGSSFLTAYNNECTLFEPLRGRRCVLFPDSDQLDTWSTKADVLRRQGFNVQVDTSWTQVLTPEQVAEGWDLADTLYLNR